MGYGAATRGLSHARLIATSRFHPRPGADRWSVIERSQPAMLRFGYRQSPHLLQRLSPGSIGNWFKDPAPRLPGMVEVRLDTEGRLIGFLGIPPQETPDDKPEEDPDWDPLFESRIWRSERPCRPAPPFRPSKV